MLAPINKIPPEILALIPDFWNMRDRDQDVIALTHVCRAWRKVFVSRSCLWTDFDRLDEEKTQVYFERSGSSPVSLSLYRDGPTLPHDPLFKIIPHVTGRLVSLFIKGAPENIQDITSHLYRPAPLLEGLTICSNGGPTPRHDQVLPSALFSGDLSSLRELYLQGVRTELPWRNMVNLTSFALGRVSPDDISVSRLLDFFESAPHLCDINLHSATPHPDAQHDRLVTLACLERIEITDCRPSYCFLDHLSIPVGAILTTRGDIINSLVGDLLPRSLDNLRNFSNFTTIQLSIVEPNPRMEFSGPNGRVNVIFSNPGFDGTRLALESLAQLDTSSTEYLVIEEGKPRSSRSPLYQALLPMTDLRTIELSGCRSPHIFAQALQPSMNSSEVVVCPKLEELILESPDGVFDIKSVTKMAAARASRGKKLRTVKLVDRQGELDPKVILELKKHVSYVECASELARLMVNSDTEDRRGGDLGNVSLVSWFAFVS